jgi:hypothetical protein
MPLTRIGKRAAHKVRVDHPDAFAAASAAKRALAAGDLQTANALIATADLSAAKAVNNLRSKVNARVGTKTDQQVNAACANELIRLRKKLQEVSTVANNQYDGPPILGPVSAPRPPQPVGPGWQGQGGTYGKGGYSQAGGLIQAPPGAGMYMRLPFNDVDNAQALVQGDAYTLVEANPAVAGTRTIAMQTPNVPWLTYRLRGLLIQRFSNAAGAADSIRVSALHVGGGPNLIIGDGQLGIESFRMGDRHLVGLRYNPVVQSPDVLNLTISGNQVGQDNIQPAGDSILYVSAVIETIEDSTYGKINNWQYRLNQGSLGGGQGQGYVFPQGAPISGTIQRIPMRVLAAAGPNVANTSCFRLNNALAAAGGIVLQSEQISWAEMQIVGFEISTPTKTNVLDVLTVEDLTVRGGASLFPQAGQIPAINYIGDESGQGGGMHSMCGLRFYPLLSATNTCQVTVSGIIGTTGAAGLAGTVDVAYCNVLVDRIVDDVFGVQPAGAQAPYGGLSVPTGLVPPSFTKHGM